MYQAEFIFEENSIEGLAEHHSATIAGLPGGDIMAAWYSCTREATPDSAIYFSILKKGGREWTPPRVVEDTPGVSNGNPVLFVDRKGAVHCYYVSLYGDWWTGSRIMRKISADGGSTWGDEETIIDEKGWMLRNKPVTLNDGGIVFPVYDEKDWTPGFLGSEDGGRSWDFLARGLPAPGGGAIQPTVIQRDTGELFALLRTRDAGRSIWSFTSPNGGRNWSEPRRTKKPNPDSGIDMVKLDNGNVVLAYNNAHYTRTPLNVTFADNQHGYWLQIRILEKDTGEFSYPSIIQGADGLIHIVYTYNRRTIKHAAFDENWVRGTG